MSFGTYARKVRDTELSYGRRIIAVSACVGNYHPIGFQETLDFLAVEVGDFRRDQSALVPALDLLEISRDAWKAEVRTYAARRKQAKLLGQRTPRPAEPNPYRPVYWYGPHRRLAMLYLLRCRKTRVAGSSRDPIEADIHGLIEQVLKTAGRLGVDERELLRDRVRDLSRRLTAGAWKDDAPSYFRNQSLFTIAQHIDGATGED